jgi:hypothetical protein
MGTYCSRGMEIKSKYLNEKNLLPTTRNLLCVLEEEKIIRLKKNTSRNTKYLDGVFENFKNLAKQNPEIKYFESHDNQEMVIMFDINYKISSFII